MALTQEEIYLLTNKHRTEISALNAIVKLINNGASSSDISNLLASFNANSKNNRTPNIVRVTASGVITEDVFSFSIYNAGGLNGTILGSTIKPGETFSFSAGALNNIYPANSISYNGTNTELVIIYNS